MKKMLKKAGILVTSGIGISLIGVSVANAALDTASWKVDLTATDAIMAIVMPALLLMWGYRKAIKTANRS